MLDPEELHLIAQAVQQNTRIRPPQRASTVARITAVIFDHIAMAILCFFVVAAFIVIKPLRDSTIHNLQFLVSWAVIMAYSSLELFPCGSLGKSTMDITIGHRSARAPSRLQLVIRWGIKYSIHLLIGVSTSVMPAIRALSVARGAFDFEELFYRAIGYVFFGLVILTILSLVAIILPPYRAIHDWITATDVFNAGSLANSRAPARAFEVTLPVPTQEINPAREPSQPDEYQS